MKHFKLLGALFLFIAIGCSTSTRITTSWKADKVSAKDYKKIMVLGLIGNNDRIFREKMEDHLAGDLKDLGYNAITATSEYGPRAFENMKEDDALRQLYDKGIDAVLTIVLLDKQRERYYLPGRVYYSPYIMYHNRFWRYYTTMYDRVYSEGYYVVDTKYFWESNLYDMNDWTLLYSAQSHSFDPSSAETLGHEYGMIITKDMIKKNVLQQQTKKAF
jgi:hypothetical protein